jgi:uncharacterized protein (UPF0216 family)
MTNTVSLDKTHIMEMSTVKTDAVLISLIVYLRLIVTIFDENKSHLEKNTYPEINPKAQKIRHSISLTAIVIKP